MTEPRATSTPTATPPTATPPATDPPTSRTRRLLLPAVLLVALLAVTAYLFLSGREDGDAAPAGATSADRSAPQQEDSGEVEVPADASQEEVFAALAALARREEGDPMALGQADAPVVMIAYSEFQCPFCGRFARETEPALVEEFVEDGLLRIEWRDFPYLGEESRTAALAGRAAAAQDLFWEFEEALFDDQQPPNSGRLTPDFLAGVAERAGLDREQFLTDLESQEAAAGVDRDFTEGQSIGVTGTPAFLINGRPLMGAQPTDVFVEAVEQALAEAKGGR